MTKKPKIGRPPRNGVAASNRLDLRMPPAMRDSFDRAAARRGLSTTEWLLEAAELALVSQS